nr:hypothetical protein [Tanacetum cinerariifolium]GEV96173.1 hypothetical protein [Tanacetum cinerariifolium]
MVIENQTRTTIIESHTGFTWLPTGFWRRLSEEDLSETAKSLHTQTSSTLVVHPPPTRPLPTSLDFSRRPKKEILMPLGYRAVMDRWRAASSSTCHPLFSSKIPSSTSPPSLLPSSSSPPPLLLPPSSRKRSKSPSPSPPPLVSPSPLPSPAPTTIPPPTEHIEKIRDGARTRRTDMTEQDMETSRARVKEGKVAENASNKRKWEGDHGGSSSQSKGHKVIRAHDVRPSNKKGRLGHYKSDCSKWKNHKQVIKQWKGKAHGDSSVMTLMLTLSYLAKPNLELS